MKHLYNVNKIEKLKWFAKRFGIKEILLKPIRYFISPLVIKFKKKSTFEYKNKKYEMFYHKYNITWANERCVEIPIVYNEVYKEIINKKKVLEVGNVLYHYYKPFWDIIDKFEKGDKVENEDICFFKSNKKYNLIVSISTFEHIGYDDDNSFPSSKKIIMAWNNLKNNFLFRNGRIIITVPIGYNPKMDKLISKNAFGFNKEIFLKKIKKNEWIEVSKKEALKSEYGKPFPYGNCIMIGEYKR